MPKAKILIIKYGNFTDFIACTGVITAIAKKHKGCKIHLLTSKNIVKIIQDYDVITKVIEEKFHPLWQYKQYLGFLQSLKREGYFRVYDLTQDSRSLLYFRLIGRQKPQWLNSIKWSSHPFIAKKDGYETMMEYYKDMLAIANIRQIPPPNLNWFALNKPTAVEEEFPQFKTAGEELQNLSETEGGFALINPLEEDYFFLQENLARFPVSHNWDEMGFIEAIDWLNEKGIMPVILNSSLEEKKIKLLTRNLKAMRAKYMLLPHNPPEDWLVHYARLAKIAIGNNSASQQVILYSGCITVIIDGIYSYGNIYHNDLRQNLLLVNKYEDVNQLLFEELKEDLEEIDLSEEE